MLQPLKTKYRKQQRGRLKGKDLKNSKLIYGSYGLKALSSTWITSNQISTMQKFLTKNLKKNDLFWIKLFPDKPVTARSKESRMGSGKGAVSFWVAPVKAGNVFLEIDKQISSELACKLFKALSYKLPMKVKMISKI